jgi:hypothetical protein
MKQMRMSRPGMVVVAVLLGALGAAGLSTQVAALGHESEAREAAALDARQRQVLGGLLRAARAGALAQR